MQSALVCKIGVHVWSNDRPLSSTIMHLFQTWRVGELQQLTEVHDVGDESIKPVASLRTVTLRNLECRCYSRKQLEPPHNTLVSIWKRNRGYDLRRPEIMWWFTRKNKTNCATVIENKSKSQLHERVWMGMSGICALRSIYLRRSRDWLPGIG